MYYLTAISKAVSEGKTKSQFAIPDGKYQGDLFFITDIKNKILIGFMWTGDKWIHEYETFIIDDNIDISNIEPSKGFKIVNKV